MRRRKGGDRTPAGFEFRVVPLFGPRTPTLCGHVADPGNVIYEHPSWGYYCARCAPQGVTR